MIISIPRCRCQQGKLSRSATSPYDLHQAHAPRSLENLKRVPGNHEAVFWGITALRAGHSAPQHRSRLGKDYGYKRMRRGAVVCNKSIRLQHNQFVLRVGWEAQGMGIQTVRAAWELKVGRW